MSKYKHSSLYNDKKNEYNFSKPDKPSCKPSCHCDNHSKPDYDCFEEKKCKRPDSFSSDCCTESIRRSLEIIKDTTRILNNSSTLDVILYTSNGSSHTITFTSRDNCSVEITKDFIIYNDLAIALNSITKIEVVTSSLSDEFRDKLLNKLCCLANACENPYLAYDLDDDYCPKCKKERCNCKCSNTLENFVVENQDDIATLSLLGDNESVFSISDTSFTSVVSDVNTTIDRADVISSADIITTSTNVVSNVSTISSSVISSINTDTDEVVSDIRQNTARVISSTSTNPVEVVNFVDTETVEVVENVTANTDTIDVVNDYSLTPVVRAISKSSAEGITDIDFDETQFLDDIDTENVNVVRNIDENTTNVIDSVSSSTEPAVSDVSYETTEVVNRVSPETTSILTASDPDFIDVINDIIPETVTLYQDITTETSSAVVDVRTTTRNVVNNITTDTVNMINNINVDYDDVVDDLTVRTTPVVRQVNSNTKSFVSDVTFDSADVLLASENHSAIDSVLFNLDTDTNTQAPRTVTVGNCLGEGTLEVVAENVPVSIVEFTTNLTNKLNCMIDDINKILKKCCCNRKPDYDEYCDCHHKCDSDESCDCNDHYNKYDRKKYNYNKDESCRDKKHRCPSIPHFKVCDLLSDVYFDLNAYVTINGSPVESSCVDISVFDESTDNYLHNIDSSYLADNVFSGFNPDEHTTVAEDLNKTFDDAVYEVNATTIDAVSRVTFSNLTVVNTLAFTTSVVRQVRNISTAAVVNNISLSKDSFVQDVDLADAIDVVSSIDTSSTSVVSNFDTSLTDIVTDIVVGTTDVVSSIDTETENYVSSISTTSRQVLESLDIDTINVVEDVTSSSVNGLSNLSVSTQQFLTNVTASNTAVVSSLDINSAEIISSLDVERIDVVSEVNTDETIINNLSNTNTITVVTSVVPVFEDIETIDSISTGTLVSVNSITTVPVINSVQLDSETTSVVSDVTVSEEFVSVVESVNGEDIAVLSGDSPIDVDAASTCAGNGLLIVEENSGNISIYSLCKLQSVELE